MTRTLRRRSRRRTRRPSAHRPELYRLDRVEDPEVLLQRPLHEGLLRVVLAEQVQDAVHPSTVRHLRVPHGLLERLARDPLAREADEEAHGRRERWRRNKGSESSKAK